VRLEGAQRSEALIEIDGRASHRVGRSTVFDTIPPGPSTRVCSV
jgi:hypothetical protein